MPKVDLIVTSHVEPRGLPVVDGTQTEPGMVVLLQGQDSPADNGVWFVMLNEWQRAGATS